MSQTWRGSSVMEEFAKIAAESGLITSDLMPDGREDFVGNPSKTKPVDGATRSEPTEDYNKRDNDEGKKLIEKAHPQDAQMADAMGKGGLVENQVQQQEVSIDVATKMPDGAQHGVHASVIVELVKLANTLDEAGNHKAAMLVDSTIQEVRSLPFDNGHLRKEAAVFTITAIIAAVLAAGGTAANMGFFSSMREGLAKDAKDLEEILQTASSAGSKSAEKAVGLLSPFVSGFAGLNFSNKKDIAKFVTTAQKFNPIMPQLKASISMVELELGESRWYYFGMDKSSRVNAKFNDFVKSYNFVNKKLLALATVGTKVLQQQKKQTTSTAGGVKGLQQILNKGFKGKTWTVPVNGVMDDATVAAAKELESALSAALKGTITKNKMKGNFTDKIVKEKKLVISPRVLLEIIRLAEKTK